MREKLKVYKLLTWYKKVREDKVQSELSKKRKELSELKKEKEKLIRQKKELYKRLYEQKTVSAERLKSTFYEANTLNALVEKLEGSISLKKREVEKTKHQLMEAFKERRLMERLTEKTEEAWRFEETKRFYKELDDLVILRYEKAENEA